MMNEKITKALNIINDWRDYVMEDSRRDFKSVIAAGKKVIAKLKNRSDSKIMAYNGADC